MNKQQWTVPVTTVTTKQRWHRRYLVILPSFVCSKTRSCSQYFEQIDLWIDARQNSEDEAHRETYKDKSKDRNETKHRRKEKYRSKLGPWKHHFVSSVFYSFHVFHKNFRGQILRLRNKNSIRKTIVYAMCGCERTCKAFLRYWRNDRREIKMKNENRNFILFQSSSSSSAFYPFFFSFYSLNCLPNSIIIIVNVGNIK